MVKPVFTRTFSPVKVAMEPWAHPWLRFSGLVFDPHA